MKTTTLIFLVSAGLFCAAGRAVSQEFDANTFNTGAAISGPEASPSEAVELPSNENPDDPATWVGSRAPLRSDLSMQDSGQVSGTENFQGLLQGYSILKAATTFDDWTYGTGKGQVVCTTLIKYSLLDYMAKMKYPAGQIAYIKGLSNGAPEMREQIAKDIKMAAEAEKRLGKLRTVVNPSEEQKQKMRDYEDMSGRVPFEAVRRGEYQPGDVLFFSTRHVVFYVQPYKDGQRLGIYHAAGVDHDVTYSALPHSFIMKAFRLKVQKGANI